MWLFVKSYSISWLEYYIKLVILILFGLNISVYNWYFVFEKKLFTIFFLK